MSALNKTHIEHLLTDIDKNITGLVNTKDYRKVISRNNLLFGFDTLNKILIKLQNSDAFDVRTQIEWQIAGRELKQDANEIVIASPNKKIKYFDTRTGEELVISALDLTPDELKQAIENKLVEREITYAKPELNVVYDVRSTVSTNGSKYKLNRPKANTGNLLMTFGKFMNMQVKLDTKTQISSLNNTCYIKNEPFEIMVVNVAKLITNEIMTNRLKDILKKHNIKLDIQDENVIKLLSESLIYSICSMFKVEYKCDFFTYYYIKNNGVLDIIMIVDIIGNQLHTLTNYILPIGDVGSVNSIDKIKRGEELWGMITAFDLMNKMKGTC